MLFDSDADRTDFFNTHIAVNYGCARRAAGAILRCEADAADAVQDAMLAAWEKLDQLRSAESADSWFRSIVKNKAISIYRELVKEEPVAYIDERLWATSDPGPEAACIRAENRRLLSEVYEELSPVYREHLYYRAFLQLGPAEITAIMNISEKTRANAFSRAKASFRKRYYQRIDEE